MSSINAENVAKDVLQHISNGKQVVMSEILKKHGYSHSVQRALQPVTRTKSYINTLDKGLKRMQKHADKLLQAMENKDLSQEDYRVLSESYSRMRKDMLLAQGKSTDNIAVSVNVIDYTNTTD